MKKFFPFSFAKLPRYLIGAPRNPFDPSTRRHIALIAFFAWIGIGADGLSSSCYGPEEAFLALGTHTHLSLYLALATALTVFIISTSYNQVIELFPTGGGGYRVSTKLIGPYAGLVSGSALIVDYILTITISIASAVDALFSLLPVKFQVYKFVSEVLLILVLTGLNLRGMKESIKVLMPIFLGFVITHAVLIIYGIFAHKKFLPDVFFDTVSETKQLAHNLGWTFVAALFLRAYSLGGGTYTGLEAVSNNVNYLAEPRVATGKWTMFYMALSLSFTAGGVILLYLLWQVQPVDGQTLNATVFSKILSSWDWGPQALFLVLILEAGLLFVGANTGFLGGPAVLANMSLDRWVPNRFQQLSNRLVTQNGVILFGLASLAILFWSQGEVSLLVILYSINVFLTFSLSLLGLCIYWWKGRRTERRWRRRLALSLVGLSVSVGILLITLIAKFTYGGWVTVIVTSMVILLCLIIRKQYLRTAKQLSKLDALLLGPQPSVTNLSSLPLNPNKPTAAFMVGKNPGVIMHTLLWAQRMFPNHFKNFIFVSAGIVDVESYGGQNSLEAMKKEVGDTLNYFVQYCHAHNQPALALCKYGTNPVVQLSKMAEKISVQYPNTVFFASKLVFAHDNWFNQLLHNDTAFSLQRKLHLKGIQLVILPIKIE
jgi:amino acid transporter